MSKDQPIITFSDDVSDESIANVLGLLAGRRVLVTCSDESQVTGEVQTCLHAEECFHIQVWDSKREELTNWRHIAVNTIEEVTYL